MNFHWTLTQFFLVIELCFILTFGGCKGIGSEDAIEVSITNSKKIKVSAPSLVELNSTLSITSDPTPTFTISGTTSGDTVRLFSDAACTTRIASGISTGANFTLTTNFLDIGTYTLYAKAISPSGNATPCVGPMATYTLSDIKIEPLYLDDTPLAAVELDDRSILLGGKFQKAHTQKNYKRYFTVLNPDGTPSSLYNVESIDGMPTDYVIQPDGKLVMVGFFRNINGQAANHIARINPDGTLDTTFNTGLGFVIPVSPLNIDLQSSGKLIIVGGFIEFNSNNLLGIIRLNSDGSYDSTFSVGGTGPFPNSNANLNVKVLGDDSIIIFGNFTFFNAVSRNRIIKLSSNGAVDGSFVVGTGFNDLVTDVEYQSDGKLICVGKFTTFKGTAANKIVRLTSTGAIDGTFNATSGFDLHPYTIKIQNDDSIILGGGFLSYNGNSSKNIVKLTSNGTFDSSFVVGSGFDDAVLSLDTDTQGNIYAGGKFLKFNGQAQISTSIISQTGSLVTNHLGFTDSQGEIVKIGVLSDQSIILFGSFYGIDFNNTSTDAKYLFAINRDGSFNQAINQNLELNDYVNTMAKQSDGKIVVGGRFTQYQSTNQNRIVRLNADGSRDDLFAIGTGFNGEVTLIKIQPDLKIIVHGSFNEYNGVSISNLVRLNSDGSLDVSFNSGTGVNRPINDLEILDNGKINIVGRFTLYNSITHNGILRLNSDGTIDGTLNFGTGFNSFPTVYSISSLSDGSMVVSGLIPSYQGALYNNSMIKILSNGTKDGTFPSLMNFGSIQLKFFLSQNSQSFFLFGRLNTFDTLPCVKFCKLNLDGSRETNFNNVLHNGSSISGHEVKGALELTDGSLFLYGRMKKYENIQLAHVLFLNADGSLRQ